MESLFPPISLMSLDGGFSFRFSKWFLLPDIVHEQKVSMLSMKESVSNWLGYDLLEVLTHAGNVTILGCSLKNAIKLATMEDKS